MHVYFSLLTMLDMLMKRTSVNAGGGKSMSSQKNLAIFELVEYLENSERPYQLNIHILKSLNLLFRREAILPLKSIKCLPIILCVLHILDARPGMTQ